MLSEHDEEHDELHFAVLLEPVKGKLTVIRACTFLMPGLASLVAPNPVQPYVFSEHYPAAENETAMIATYKACSWALDQAMMDGVWMGITSPLTLFTHFRLLHGHLTGEYRVDHHALEPLVAELKSKLAKFEPHVVQWLPSEENPAIDEALAFLKRLRAHA